jgi:Protein kinase domain
MIRHGSKVGRFVVVAELGSGGMGVVYAAHDRELDRQVALKVMRWTDDEVAEEDRIRMLREGQAMARVVHPNVITVFEVGTEGGMVFLAQELLDGGTLAKWLEQPHPQDEIIEKFVAAGRGLAAAHAAKLVHRDFKPDNVLLGKDGRVRVSDFGLARAVGSLGELAVTDRGGGPPRTDDVTKSPMHNLTRTGAVMGTPMFMAPEQHEGRRADERSDQFAFCVALYHSLYKDWPFDGKTSIALADNVINGVMKPPPKSATVSPRVRKILLRGLSKDADARYPSMEALLAELTAPVPKSGKTVAFAIAALVIVVGGAAAAFVMLRDKPKPPAAKIEPAPVPVATKEFDPTLLVRAIDQGTLDTVEDVFNREVSVMARASAAYMIALRGDLAGAAKKLAEAEAVKSTDPKAKAYIDMATAAIDHARGDLKTAYERAESCANTLGNTDPIPAAMCLQIQGDAAADRDEVDLAKRAYGSGDIIAQKLGKKELSSMFELSLAQLEFDQKEADVSLDAVEKLRAEARRRRAASCEAGASVLMSSMQLRKGEDSKALAIVDDMNIDPTVLQMYRRQAIAKIAIGEVYGYRNEADIDGETGPVKIEKVLQEASKKEFWGVVLEAKLARMRVFLTLEDPSGETERKNLVEEATSKGYKRIARLAQSYIPFDKPADPAGKPVEKPSDVPDTGSGSAAPE